MRAIDALAIGSAIVLFLFGLGYLAENTATGRALTAYALVHILGDRRAAPREDEECCRVAMTERRYYVHRVRVHGEGQA